MHVSRFGEFVNINRVCASTMHAHDHELLNGLKETNERLALQSSRKKKERVIVTFCFLHGFVTVFHSPLGLGSLLQGHGHV